MTTDHPMKLTLEQFNDLICQDPNATWFDRLSLAYAAGADAQLEACCKWNYDNLGSDTAEFLRDAMRPKPPSLKEQALADLDMIQTHDSFGQEIVNLSNIRRALEALSDD